MTKKRSHSDTGTRQDWYLELLNTWERALEVAERKHLTSIARNYRAAIFVLKSTYSVDELIDLEKYEKKEK